LHEPLQMLRNAKDSLPPAWREVISQTEFMVKADAWLHMHDAAVHVMSATSEIAVHHIVDFKFPASAVIKAGWSVATQLRLLYLSKTTFIRAVEFILADTVPRAIGGWAGWKAGAFIGAHWGPLGIAVGPPFGAALGLILGGISGRKLKRMPLSIALRECQKLSEEAEQRWPVLVAAFDLELTNINERTKFEYRLRVARLERRQKIAGAAIYNAWGRLSETMLGNFPYCLTQVGQTLHDREQDLLSGRPGWRLGEVLPLTRNDLWRRKVKRRYAAARERVLAIKVAFLQSSPDELSRKIALMNSFLQSCGFQVDDLAGALRQLRLLENRSVALDMKLDSAYHSVFRRIQTAYRKESKQASKPLRTEIDKIREGRRRVREEINALGKVPPAVEDFEFPEMGSD